MRTKPKVGVKIRLIRRFRELCIRHHKIYLHTNPLSYKRYIVVFLMLFNNMDEHMILVNCQANKAQSLLLACTKLGYR